ncbi:DUF4179 domain-containing protein [Anaerobacillus sp. CMMVII]|uniref:DUF4179 domain-containing protein n=1 Tax=Anaerobacillus sp. CMMVII TaxID=2755588 RepID=UPI0021B83153|nr:DUF4179 domain-containing protein [Anaerobacillus sp. CMMVII]
MSKVGWFDDQVGFGKVVNLSTVDNNIEFTITHVSADEEETILYFQIKDLENNHNFFIDYASFHVDEIMLGTFARGNIINMDIEDDGVSKGKLHLLPLLTEEETIRLELNEVFWFADEKIQPYSMEWFDEKNRSVVEGNWKLDIPVKKDRPVTYDLNETMEVHGKTIEFTEMVVSPTRTTLTYQYQRDQSNQNNFFIRLSHLEVNKDFCQFVIIKVLHLTTFFQRQFTRIAYIMICLKI